jgi:hypothetical protein
VIKFALLKGGGFVAGDTDTGLTAYAYPKSDYATEAKKYPQAIARKMLSGERRFARPPWLDVKDYDKRNWERQHERKVRGLEDER